MTERSQVSLGRVRVSTLATALMRVAILGFD